MDEPKVMQIKNGWLALSRNPGLAGFGKTPEDAVSDWERGIAQFQLALARYRSLPTGA
jgi:hypothetical protein